MKHGLAALLVLMIIIPTIALSAPQDRFELSARINPTHGAFAGATWLDSENYLTLVVGPDGADVFKHDYTTSRPTRFMSADFVRKHVCSDAELGRLSWELSPAKKYLSFTWFDADGNRYWALIDIQNAPNFKLKRFVPPQGMQIARMLFSPDDRYAVFVHDSMHGDCDVSVLVLDLDTSSEHWRLTTQQVNFISDLWWGGNIYGSPKFFAAAKLHDGQFAKHPGLARFDIDTKELTFVPTDDGVICGAEAVWGKAATYETPPGEETPYELRAMIGGEETPRLISLSSQPVALKAHSIPGILLLSNTADWVTNQLWLIDVVRNKKILVDPDCEEYSLSPDGKLIVRARSKLELRIYEPVTGEDSRQVESSPGSVGINQ